MHDVVTLRQGHDKPKAHAKWKGVGGGGLLALLQRLVN